MGILRCDENRVTVQEEVQEPLEERIRTRRRECRQQRCKKRCFCCNKWACWFEVLVLTVVRWVVRYVVLELLYWVCRIFEAFLDFVLAFITFILCHVLSVVRRVRRPPEARRVKHIFVLMLENRSFDHMLGFSGIPGIDGLAGDEFNYSDANDPSSQRIAVSRGAEYAFVGTMENDDPPHEFEEVFRQLTGQGLDAELWDGQYPAPANSGFVHSYLELQPSDPTRVMHCFTPDQVPVIVELARQYAVCDRWFSSMPGPTWPNRFFVHAGTAGGQDYSPGPPGTIMGELFGYSFVNGTIYDRLDETCLSWRVFAGDPTPQVFALNGMTTAALQGKFAPLSAFRQALQDDDVPSYVFIEPDYGNVLPGTSEDFTCGNSQHPLDDVTRGEELIKDVYEAIRNSPAWERSLLVITWDEHGGFYDHREPPATVAPGDGIGREHSFDFTRLGVRVPTIVVSPWIERGTVDSVTRDHTSVLATVEAVFGLRPLTARDEAAEDLLPLLTRESPRLDDEEAPTSLPAPSQSGFSCRSVGPSLLAGAHALMSAAPQEEAPDEGSEELPPLLAGFAHVAFLRHYELVRRSGRKAREEAIAAFRSIRTAEQARAYIHAVRTILEVENPVSLVTPPIRLVQDRPPKNEK